MASQLWPSNSITADFIVEESLPFVPEGSGEHVFLQIQKTGENTEFVARALARFAGVRQRDIGFAGLKDRHAVTTQWFSIWLPGKADPDWTGVETDSIKILQALRHSRKLKRGVLDGNRFKLVIRDFNGDRDTCERQLEAIKKQGFPNYFGEQRFGHHGKNIETALALFNGTKKIKRQQRGIYLSAARSFLFNQILSRRVEAGNWNQAISGDVFTFADSRSHFKPETFDDALLQRLQDGDLHPTGPLYGKGDSLVADAALEIEEAVIADHREMAAGLLDFDMETERRALRVQPGGFHWQFSEQQLQLDFFLPAGSYATALLRETIATQETD